MIRQGLPPSAPLRRQPDGLSAPWAHDNLHSLGLTTYKGPALELHAEQAEGEPALSPAQADSMLYWYEMFSAATETLVLNMAQWEAAATAPNTTDKTSKAHAAVLAAVAELARLHTALMQDRRRSIRPAPHFIDATTTGSPNGIGNTDP
jgi:hypothetical protein